MIRLQSISILYCLNNIFLKWYVGYNIIEYCSQVHGLMIMRKTSGAWLISKSVRRFDACNLLLVFLLGIWLMVSIIFSGLKISQSSKFLSHSKFKKFNERWSARKNAVRKFYTCCVFIHFVDLRFVLNTTQFSPCNFFV